MSFAAVQNKIASKEGVSKERAGAILASSTRNTSPAAKRANPNLKKVLPAKSHPSAAHKTVHDFWAKHKG